MPIYDVDKIQSKEDVPEGIDGVIKLAAYFNDKINGLMYFDRHNRFPDGYPVVTSTVVSVDGNVYHTKNSKYIVEVIQNG